MKTEDIKGKIFSIQRYSTNDGDGIRTCVFFKGCPLKCIWCHNAESVLPETEISYARNSCMLCGACAAVCPNVCHKIENGVHIFNRDKCVQCGKCAEVCPTAALNLIGEYVTAAEVLKRVERDRNFYTNNGGITLTGGEPMAQPEFCLAVAKLAAAAEISVNIETSGCCRTEDIAAVTPYVDTFLFDCKADGVKHKSLTGIDDGLILKNLAEICSLGARVALRCPVIPGANLTEEFVEKIAELANRLRNIKSVELLPYHKTGAGKALMLGRTAQSEFEIPSDRLMSDLRTKLAGMIKRDIIVK